MIKTSSFSPRAATSKIVQDVFPPSSKSLTQCFEKQRPIATLAVLHPLVPQCLVSTISTIAWVWSWMIYMLHKSRDGHLAQKLEILWYCVVYTIHMVTYHDIYSICVHVFVLFQILVRTLPLYPLNFNTKEASPSLLTMARSLVSEVVDGPNYHGPSLAAVPSRTLFHKLSATPCIHIVFWWSSQLATASQPWL